NKEMPVIDDEFAKYVREFDTLDALKEYIKAKNLERKTKMADEEVENDLIGAVVDGMKAEIPEAMIENRSNESVREFDYRLRSQGMDLETYLKYTGTNVEEFKKTFRPQSEKQVKMRLALEKIVELEGLTATEEEIAAEYDKVAANYGIEAEQVKASIPEKDIVHDIALNKAVDLVKASAVITDVEKKTEKEEKKAPAKKPAAKKTTAKKTTKKAETEEKAETAE
ncbi:MAG: trigger factor, partial [Clostridia bacterium]|nr:trigger factor [Clostridia bacterium]